MDNRFHKCDPEWMQQDACDRKEIAALRAELHQSRQECMKLHAEEIERYVKLEAERDELSKMLMAEEKKSAALAAHSEVMREALDNAKHLLADILRNGLSSLGEQYPNSASVEEQISDMEAALQSSPAHSVRRWEKMKVVVEAAKDYAELSKTRTQEFRSGLEIRLANAVDSLFAMDKDDGEGKP